MHNNTVSLSFFFEIIIVVVLVIIVLAFIAMYNGFIQKRNRVQDAHGPDRRAAEEEIRPDT